MSDLKTLKDFKKEILYITKFEPSGNPFETHYFEGRCASELNLCPVNEGTDEAITFFHLRQEAIRQAKTLMKEMEIEYIEFEDIKVATDWDDLIDVACHAKDSEYHAGYGILYWLVKFFNISKEDLK